MDMKVVIDVSNGTTYAIFNFHSDHTTSSHLFNLRLVAEVFCELVPHNNSNSGGFLLVFTHFRSLLKKCENNYHG